MPVDVNKFLQTFIEEGIELLLDAENTLLVLDVKNVDKDSINKIFRCMHSIKGASAVFNFNAINEFAHTLENYLDNIRSNKHILTQDDVNLLLKSIDGIRTIIINLKNKETVDYSYVKKLNKQFKEKLILTTADAIPVVPQSAIPQSEQQLDSEYSYGWEINFVPSRNLFQSNNDPLPIFKNLTEHGQLEIKVNTNRLPNFLEFDPNECFLSWELKLHTDAPKNEIQDILFWVGNEENFIIKPIAEAKSETIKENKNKSVSSTPGAISNKAAATSVRISIEKIDNIINLIGELIITQSMINQICSGLDMSIFRELKEGLVILENNTKQLQENVMQIRMVAIDSVFNRFKRLIYDMANNLGKKVELVISGEQTEIDKNMIEKISDPILHLIRNALDHGIELPEERKLKNKPSTAVIQLNAYQETDNIVIDVIDDGRGLNKDKIRAKAISAKLLAVDEKISDDQLYQFIFQPGFSTAEHLSDVSGRGVGLDVVYKNICELGGEVEIETKEGEGTKFRLRLPLTLAIMDCQLIKINGQVYIIPLINIAEIIRVESIDLNQIDNNTIFYSFRDNYIPVIHMDNYFYNKEISKDVKQKFLIVVEAGKRMAGLVIDELLAQQQVVIKSLEENYEKINGISGVTILGDGKVGLIIDVKTVISRAANTVGDTSLNSTNTSDLLPYQDEKMNYQGEDTFQFLSFMLGNQVYGVDILTIKEIRTWEEATILPNTPSDVKGIINVRGIIIPIFDLHNKFNINPLTYTEHTIIIILVRKSKLKQHYIGIVADQVLNTYSIKYNEIRQVIDINDQHLKKHLQGFITIDNKMIALINTNFLNSIITTKEEAVL